MSPSLLTIIRKSDPVLWGLGLLIVALSVHKHGAAQGLQISASIAYLIALLRLCVSISMAFLLRRPIIGKSERLLLALVAAYAVASLAFSWSSLLFLSIIGGVGGFFVGTVCAIASPYHRWR